MSLQPKRSPKVKLARKKFLKAREKYRREMCDYLLRNSRPVCIEKLPLERANLIIYSYDDDLIGNVMVSKKKLCNIKKNGVKASFVKVQ